MLFDYLRVVDLIKPFTGGPLNVCESVRRRGRTNRCNRYIARHASACRGLTSRTALADVDRFLSRTHVREPASFASSTCLRRGYGKGTGWAGRICVVADRFVFGRECFAVGARHVAPDNGFIEENLDLLKAFGAQVYRYFCPDIYRVCFPIFSLPELPIVKLPFSRGGKNRESFIFTVFSSSNHRTITRNYRIFVVGRKLEIPRYICFKLA